MARHGEAATRREDVVEYVADDKLAQSGSARYMEWKREVVEPLKIALVYSEPELGDWLATTCEKAVQGCLDPPTAPGGPCVVNGEVLCSPYAITTFISSEKVSRSFASEFDLPAEDEPEIPQKDASERTERYFSARVLAEVFLSYRVVLAQLADAGPQEQRALRDSWFHASVRAACDLVRPAHFAILSNLSFAVVCCIVDSGYEMQSVWPASLMTQDRMRAARKRVDFAAWASMSCLPLIRACNLCAASQGKKQGRPRICTFIPADDKSIVSCLACTMSGKKSACKIVYVKDSTDGAEQDYGEDENSDDDVDDDAETSTTTLTQPTGCPPMRTLLATAKRGSCSTFEEGTRKRIRMIPEVGREAGRQRSAQDTPKSKGGSPAKDARPKNTAAPSKRLVTRKPLASETPGAGSSDLACDYDAGAASEPWSAVARSKAQWRDGIPGPGTGQPALAPRYSALRERRDIEQDHFSEMGRVNERAFMRRSGHETATLALNASSTSGATVKVPLVDYESLVRFHEAMSHLERMTGAARAAVRGRTTIDAVRRSRQEEDEVMRSIALARKELSRLEDQITLSRGEVRGGDSGESS